MKLEYGRRAEADLDAIFEYLNQRNPQAAAAVLKTIRGRISKLAEFPFTGRRTKRREIRCLIIVRYPYKVYYRVRGTMVSIVHIRDSRRAPWKGAG